MGAARQSRPASRNWRSGICRLRMIDPHQFDTLDHLPERPPRSGAARSPDPIGSLLESRDAPTGSIRGAEKPPNDRDRCQPQRPMRRRRAAARSRAKVSVAPARSLRTLLYGRNVDRAAQDQGAARARHPGLRRRSMRSSPGGSCMFAAIARQPPAPRAAHRAGRGRDRAARHARPQRRDSGDRRASALAVRRAAAGSSTSTRRPSCSPRVLPDLDAAELRERLGSKRGFVWLKRDITPKQQRGDLSARPARHRLPAGEQARLSERRRGLAPDRARQHRQPGHRRHREMARRQRARRPAPGRASPPTG